MSYNLTVRREGAVFIIGGTGGAGSAIVRAFAKTGASIAFTYNSNETKANALVDELAGEGVTAAASKLDITDLQAVEKCVGEVVERFGHIHTVIYASGPMWDNTLQLADVKPGFMEFLVKTELFGFFNVISATKQQMRAHKGVITICTSFGNARRFDRDGQSAVPKAGLESMALYLAAEEAVYGVRANVVRLGWFNFGMGAIDKTEAALDDPGRAMTGGEAGAEALEWMTSRIRLGNRPGRGEELASMVLYLSSEQASYVTGQITCVDGGISL